MNILIPRNLEGRKEKRKQALYKLFQQEVIEGDITIDMDLDFTEVKTKRINGYIRFKNITRLPSFLKDIEQYIVK